MRFRLFGIGTMCWLLLWASAASAQVRVGDSFKWDQPTGEVASIARFELSIDGSTFNDVGKVEANDGGTQANHTSYRATVPALTSGSHTFTVRACPATGACGPAAPVFSFAVVIISAPSNLRIGSED